MVQAGVNPTAHITRVINKARPRILQIQKRKQAIGIELPTKLHIGIATVLIDTIEKGARKNKICLNDKKEKERADTAEAAQREVHTERDNEVRLVQAPAFPNMPSDTGGSHLASPIVTTADDDTGNRAVQLPPSNIAPPLFKCKCG